MNPFNRFSDVRRDEMAEVVARNTGVDRRQVLPFVDFSEMLAELFLLFQKPSVGLLTAGTTLPEIAQAAHKADIEMSEQLGTSPFTGDVDAVLRGVTSTSDIIYVANPNRVTGTHFSDGELEEMAAAVPDGLVIVDEHFGDYFGPSAVALTRQYANLVVLRSITASTTQPASETGYLLAHPLVADRIGEACPGRSFSVPDRKTVRACLANNDGREHHLVEVQDEALRIAQELNRIGVQSRICPTNFVLIRVAEPALVGNALATAQVPIANLDGYPQLRHYLRYEVRSRLRNDRMLNTFRAMPVETLKIPRLDARKARLLQGSAKRMAEKGSPEKTVTSA